MLSRVRPRYRPLLCVTSSLSLTSRSLVSVDHILQDPIFEVMQFTGLYDVDDNEIYEGDIVVPVKFKEIPNVIQYIQNGFYLVKSINNKIYANLLGNCDIKIIGNIHKNPELISYKIN